MRAFAFDEFDTPGSVHELPQPEPEAGQVRVRVAAAGINPADLGVIKGFYKDMMEHRFPLIPGLDFAGTVDAVGEDANGWNVGDEVFGGMGKMSWGEGTLADYATASASTIAHRPDDVDIQFAAALPLAGLSATQCVEPMALTQGDVIVVLGAAGGIGGFAVQLAKAAGAHVIAVTRAANHGYVNGFGADEAIDYTTEDVHDVVSAAHPAGIAAIVHTAGDKDYLAHLSELVRKGGHVSSMVGGADIEGLAQRGVIGLNVMTQTTGKALTELTDLVAAAEAAADQSFFPRKCGSSLCGDWIRPRAWQARCHPLGVGGVPSRKWLLADPPPLHRCTDRGDPLRSRPSRHPRRGRANGEASTLSPTISAGGAMTTSSWSYGQPNPLICVELAAPRTESKCAAASE